MLAFGPLASGPLGSGSAGAAPVTINADFVFDYSIVGQVNADFVFNYSLGGNVSFTPSVARTIKVGAANAPFSSASSFWNMANPKAPYGLKDPDSTIDINIDWSDWLADIQDAAASFTWTVGGGATKSAEATVGALSTIFVSGGTPGVDVPLSCRITSASTPPRIEDRTVILKIEDR